MFEKVKKNFGFGCMRLPLAGEKIDYDTMCKMVDEFFEGGFNYFDTAHGYHNGLSEIAVRECLAKRYPRESYTLTNKLTGVYFEKEEDILPLFNQQLEACGVDYFDFYLMHAQTKKVYEKFKRCRAYETALELKKQGLVKHVGLSFHDTAEVLDEILTEYPEMELVQIQLNYLDWEDPVIQSRRCYEVCRKHNKPIVVMEPVKGGNLVTLPEEGKKALDSLGGGSYASYAIRFCAGLPGVFMTLSGMSNMEQMLDNVSFMKDFRSLNDDEKEAIEKVVISIRKSKLIPCTACRYCVEGCPQNIPIPDIFSCLNTKSMYSDNWNADYYYNIITSNHGKASDCIECGQCESICPQHLGIIDLLKKAGEEFDN